MSKRNVPASEQVIEGEVIRGPGYVPNTPFQPVQAKVMPREAATLPPMPQRPQLNVRLGDVAMSLPVSPMQGIVALIGTALAVKFVVPKVAQMLGGGTPRRRRRRIKMLATGGK